MSSADFESAQFVSISLGPEAVNDSRQCVNISVSGDNIAESNETFFVELLAVSGPVAIGPTSNASVTILDDDGTFREFTASMV